MNKKQLYKYLVLLPIILGIWAGWQYLRVQKNAGKVEGSIVEIQKLILDMQELGKTQPMEFVRFEGSKQSVTPNVAVGLLEKELSRAKTHHSLTTAQRSLPLVAAVAAVFALLVAILTLLKVKSATTVAMKSREHLLSAFRTTRHLLPFAATGITVAIAIALASLLGYESIAVYYADMKQKTRVYLLLICVTMAVCSLLLVLKSLISLPRAWKFFKAEPHLLFGQELSKAQAPGLWAWIEELCAKLNTSAPDHIVGGLNESFFVSSVTYQLKPNDKLLEGKLLHLPLAEMSLLSKDETAAIIGHELGHFCGDDTAYSKRFIPIYNGLERSLDVVANTQKGSRGIDLMLRPAWLLGLWVMDKFHEVVMHWSRIREFAADQVGVQIAGNAASCSALIRVVAANKPVGETMRALRSAPELIGGNFLKSLRKEAHKHGFDEPENFLDQMIAHPFDSHPPTSERLAKMGETLPLSNDLRERALRREHPDEAIWLEPMFQDLNSVMHDLTKNLEGAIHEEEVAYEKHLETFTSAVTVSRVFYERTMMNFLLLFCFGGGLTVLGVVFPQMDKTATPEKAKMVAVALVALGIFLLWLSTRYLKRSSRPFLEIGSDGFTIVGATPLIPWTKVVDVSFLSQNQFITTSFFLEPETINTIEKNHCRRAAYRKKDNAVSVQSGVVKGIKTQAYVDLIIQYLNAGRARALQLARQEEKAAVIERQKSTDEQM